MKPGSNLVPLRVVQDTAYEVRTLHTLVWSANQLLLHNDDRTISNLELESRVSDLITVTQERLTALMQKLDKLV